MRVNRATFVFSQSCSLFLQSGFAQVRDHLVDVVFRARDFALASTAIDRVRSPFVTAVATSAIARTWVVRVAAIWFTVSVRSFQMPAAPARGLTAELSFDTHFAGHGRHLIGEHGQRVDHAVDGVGQLGDLALGFENQFAFQVAVRHGGHDLCDAAHLGGEVAGHLVHGVGEILPGAGDALAPRPGRRVFLPYRLRAPRA